MGLTNIWVWVVILVVVLVLFGGRGKISSIMGDVGKGLRDFKEGVSGDDGGTAKQVDASKAKSKSGGKSKQKS